MIHFLCDRCGKPIEKGELRYVVRIQVRAAADPLEITFEDLMTDHTPEISALLRQCEGLTEEELMRDVHVEMRFDLCRACQRAYLANPMPPPVEGE